MLFLHFQSNHYPKSLHYPSGYPMPHSPPIFVCSSPGPDPYRSHDNVYEELDQQPGASVHNNLDLRADENCAGDGDGDQSLGAAPSDTQFCISTIYHDRPIYHYASPRHDRNTLTRTASSYNYISNQPQMSFIRSNNLRNQTLGNRSKTSRLSSRSGEQPNSQQPIGPPPSYDVRNIRTTASDHSHHRSLGRMKPIHIIKSNNCDNNRATAISSFAAALQHDVDVKRRNQLNNQLSYQHNGPVSTIYRGVAEPTPIERSLYCAKRSRTNPRTDRKRSGPTLDSATYGTYRQPIVGAPDNNHYDVFQTPSGNRESTALYPNVHPELCTFRQATSNEPHAQATVNTTSSQPQLNPISSRDSSFGSDSGYSHHTQSSNHIVDFTTAKYEPEFGISHINRIIQDIAADRLSEESSNLGSAS